MVIRLSSPRRVPRTKSLSLILFFLLPLSATSYADDLENELKHAISQLKAGQGPSSPQTARINSAAIAKVSRIESSQMAQTTLPVDPSRSIISHVVASKGEPFPKPENVVLPSTKIDFNPPIATSPYVEPPNSSEPPRMPARCTKEGTVKNPRDLSVAREELIIDRLFIPENLVPPEPDEVFGSKAHIYNYDTNNPSPEVRVAAESNGIPCVPFRFRITNRFEYLDYGKAAFKNYDKQYGKQSSPGFFHPWVAERLPTLR